MDQQGNNMKICCVYHSVDLDGWMSAAIVKHWYDTKPLNIDSGKIEIYPKYELYFIGYNYGQPIPDLSEYDQVIMCDISFSKEEMDILKLRLRSNFIWIDHHISAISKIGYTWNRDSSYCSGLRDVNYSACELTWMYFFGSTLNGFTNSQAQDPIPEIVRLLGRYDCFEHKGTSEEQKVLEFQYGARSCISNYQSAYLSLLESFRSNNKSVENIHNLGIAIYQYLKTEAKQIYKTGFEIELKESNPSDDGTSNLRKFICINRERFNPINFGIDYHSDGYDGVACFWYENKLWKFSLYNDNGLVDCSKIAQQYGGGGHFSAAGMMLSTKQMLSLLQ